MPSRDGAVIMDTGLKHPDRAGILALLEREKIQIASILISHFHRDHIGNIRVLREQYGATIYYSPLVCALLHAPKAISKLALNSGYVILPALAHEPGVELIKPSDRIVNAAGYDFQILDLPGHASENMGFVTPDGVAYLSDTLLSLDVLHALRLPYCENYTQDLQAKQSVLEMAYPMYILAHNGVFADVQEVALANIENMHQKAAFVENLLEDFTCLDDLTARFMTVTGAKVNEPRKVQGSRHNLQTILEFLLEEGRVTIRARNGYLEYGKA